MKYIGYCIIAFLLALAVSCKNGITTEKPVLTQVQMVPLIYELMLTEEYATQKRLKDSTLKVENIRNMQYDQVFRLRKIDPKTFSESYNYYLSHPDQMKAIYDSVSAHANQKRLTIMNPSFRNIEKVKRTAIKLNKDSLR